VTDGRRDRRTDGQAKAHFDQTDSVRVEYLSDVLHAPTHDASIMRRCLSIMHSFSVNSANIAISDTSLKLDTLCYIFVVDSISLSSTTLT